LLLSVNKNFAQQDTLSLKVVEVTANKNNLTQFGKRTEVVDSLTREQFRFNTIADILSFNSQVFIKSYGPGAIATTALRGGNASQTAVMWNGFNLQNAMLGQVDLSLLPSVLFDQVEVEYGGSSSLWGSGAVGGSIHLNNKQLFGRGFTTATQLCSGSFGAYKLAAKIGYGTSRFVSTTQLYLLGAKNNYSYKDTTDKENQEKQVKHAAYDFKGIMQQFKFLINARQILVVDAWANMNDRQLPAFNLTAQSKTYQSDAALRISANWSYIKNKLKSVVKAACFNDRINYTDSLLDVSSKSKVRTVIAENENYVDWGANHQFHTGLSFSNSSGLTDSYASTKNISRVSLIAGNKFSLLQKKLVVYGAIRAEYFSVGRLPVTGNLSLEFKPTRDLTLGTNVARVYRQPTLNELYWVPGGNVNIKPEEGYTAEGNMMYRLRFKKAQVSFSGSVFSRLIDNWILWIPGPSGNPAPLNIQKVWSRGSETSTKFDYGKSKLRAGAVFGTSYVLSTVASVAQDGNASAGRQLIYTPRYTFNGSVYITMDKTALSFYHQYTGFRFTTSDNSEWLSPYQVSSVRLSGPLYHKDEFSFFIYGACNNLFGTNYMVVSGRPMPQRNYEIGVTLKTTKRKQTVN
jgi:iron complex outermembrane receptor protein